MPVRFVIHAPDTDTALGIIASHFAQIATQLQNDARDQSDELTKICFRSKAQTWMSAADFLRQVHVERSGQTSASVEIVP